MPELPEVETVVRDLQKVVGRVITDVVRVSGKELRRPWDAAWNPGIATRRIDTVRRRGKWIVLRLGGPALIVHLGMSGQFTHAATTDDQPTHLHFRFTLDDGTELRFRDIRRFGSIEWFADEVAAHEFFESLPLGPEPNDVEPVTFRDGVRASGRSLKAILLDQVLVAGIGNIYADESCARAGLHPGRAGDSLSPAECDSLLRAIRSVLCEAIQSRGSTLTDGLYVGGHGLRGEFQNRHLVYARTGAACRTCSRAIECVRLAGRSSHFCGNCQPLRASGRKLKADS